MNRDVVLVLGKTGYGKSVWTKEYTRSKKRLLVYDLCREYPVEYYTSEQLLDLMEENEQLNELTGETTALPKEFRLGAWKTEDADILGSLAFCEGDCTLVTEEMSTLYSRGEKMDAWLREIVFLGRHRRVSLVATAQRAASIPIDLRSQANRVITFQQAEARDMTWLEDYFGERSEEISTLPKLECLDYHDDGISRYSVAHYIRTKETA
jgi:hypothetical protein